MFKNVYYNTKKSKICLWEQINGENLYTNIPWTPYLFVPSTEEDGDAKTMFGNNVKKKEFQTYYAYKKFLENNNSPNISENNLNNCIQFLAERYHGIPDDEMKAPKLLVYYVDIEVLPGDDGFPDVKNPKDPIILITVRNGITKKSVTFGYDPFENRDYTGNYKGVRYIKCNDEEELLRRFFNYIHKFPCDVLSGFNISPGFDIPYLINRSKVLWGEEIGEKLFRRMSPINIVGVWKQKSSDNLNIDIAGMTILDYIDLYKKYGKNLERNSLEFICQEELGVGKLENSYGSMIEQIEKDWNEFVDYNIIDCERVNDLEDKLGYIGMIQSLSLLCKSPMKNYISQTALIEGLMLTYFRRNRLCAPHLYCGEQKPFPAAYVKEPQKGMHEWVVDIDITSSYPSHMIVLNMSSETFFGKIIRLQESEIISYIRKREFPEFKILKKIDNEEKIVSFNGNKLRKFNIALKKGLFAIAPNGSVFNTKKDGVIAKVERYVFFKRKDVKAKRKECNLKAKECDGIEKIKYEERAREFDSLQLAIKIMANAFFGIISVPYSRYFNVYMAEAITACGRHTIKSGEIFCNDLLNNPNEKLLNIIKEIENENY